MKQAKFDSLQIETIIDKVVPMVAEPSDYEFFRGVLHCEAESCSSAAEFSAFIAKMFNIVYH
jgi:hypothetical protein